jgi:hypothetical protein
LRIALTLPLFSLVLVAALAGALLSAGDGAHAQQTVTVDMGPAEGPDGGGDQTGTVTLTAMNGQTQVVVDIDPSPDGASVAQPAHIHAGACATIGAVEFPLTSVVNGQSTTTVDISLADLQAGAYSINVHKSADEVGVYTSCGDIPAAAGATATATGTAAAVPSTGGPPAGEGTASTAVYLLLAAAALLAAGATSLVIVRRRN